MEIPARAEGAEIFALEGSLEDDSGRYDSLSWLLTPAGKAHMVSTPDGCVLYIKTGALGSLRSVDE